MGDKTREPGNLPRARMCTGAVLLVRLWLTCRTGGPVCNRSPSSGLSPVFMVWHDLDSSLPKDEPTQHHTAAGEE